MRKLHDWFQQNKREFPWRTTRTPYTTWVAEVMLQQTRAAVVIPYFERWLSRFPDVQTLATAPLEKVIKAWEGLGYYSRARNLHEGAKQIVMRFGGKIPDTVEDLQSIRGLGPYTIGAILSFGFNQRAAAVDGNVTRVISRYCLIEENIGKTSTKKKILEGVEALLDAKEPWVTGEALIELGATVCTPKPKCEECPLQEQCLAFQKGKALFLPIKAEEAKPILLRRLVLLIEREGKILVKKEEAGKVMADLYEFPYFELQKETWTRDKIVETAQKKLGVSIQILEKLAEVKHTFTRYKASLFPYLVKAESCFSVEGYQWILKEKLAILPFSSGHRKIANQL